MNTYSVRPVLLTTILAVLGCHTPPPAPPRVQAEPRRAPVPQVHESPELPRTLYNAFLGNESPEARAQLVGALRYEFRRAAALYERGSNSAAAQLVYGLLLLAQDPATLEEATHSSYAVLLHTGDEAARQGDSGRARALYELGLSHLAGPAQADARQHVQALDAFEAAVQRMNPDKVAEDRAQFHQLSALIYPSPGNFTLAHNSMVDWLEPLVQESSLRPAPGFEGMRRQHELQESIVAGVAGLISVSLREGRPARALESLDRAGFDANAARELRELLKTASGGSAQSNLELYRWLDGFRRLGNYSSQGAPRAVLDAGLFGASRLGAREGNLDPDLTLPFAATLVEFQLGEVAAHLLGLLASTDLSKDGLAYCLELGLSAIMGHAETGEIQAAERAFTELAPLFEVAAEPRFAAIEPSPATLSRVLAEAEVQAGQLSAALPRFEASAQTTASSEGYVRLANLKAKLGKTDGALLDLETATKIAKRNSDLFGESVAEATAYRILRKNGQTERARAHLGRALTTVLTLRSQNGGPVPRAAVERQLAAILEHYGETAARKRAYARALEESKKSPHELRQTLIDMARSALVERDLAMAREATHYAVHFGLDKSDAIYVALWQSLLESELHVESDGMPHQVFESIASGHGWTSYLGEWGLLRLPRGQLLAGAKGPAEQAEAAFYAGMRAEGAERTAALTRVSELPTLGLIEVAIAEALLGPKASEPLPAGVILP